MDRTEYLPESITHIGRSEGAGPHLRARMTEVNATFAGSEDIKEEKQ